MVHFASRLYDGLPTDYSAKAVAEWSNLPSPNSPVPRKRSRGLIELRDTDLPRGYFLPGFGTASNAYVSLPITEVGDGFQRASNTKSTIARFMNDQFEAGPFSAIDTVYQDAYQELMKFAEKEGYSKGFSIEAFSSGFLPEAAVAGVLPLGEDFSVFFKSRYFTDATKSIAKNYGVDTETAKLYVMMHEFSHLFGLPGGVEGEMNLETLLTEFADHQLKQVKSAGKIGETKRIEMTRIYRDIKKIASARIQMVHELYGNRDLDAMVHNLVDGESVENLSLEQLETLFDSLIDEQKEYAENQPEYQDSEDPDYIPETEKKPDEEDDEEEEVQEESSE
ncbi:hypothetical protein GOV09_06395 [Candidatus Woesearchaeota archaeon]|nr:hypothetical protein [Candidatus Woesearchaeota archaeon]